MNLLISPLRMYGEFVDHLIATAARCRLFSKTALRSYPARIPICLVESHASPLCRIMDKMGKKRKRSDDAHAEPTAKRVAAESSAKTINVSIASDDGEWGPILGM